MTQPGLAGPAGAGAGAGAWRRLDFYESRLVRDATDFASAPLAIVGQGGRRLKDIAATCACRVRPPQDAVQANASAKGKAVALEEGAIGSWIKVRPTQDKKADPVRAQVVRPGQVAVRLR